MAESNATQVILTDDGLKIIKAQNTADNAASGITNLNDPNLMSVIEKQNNIGQFAGLTSQYSVLVQNAKDDGIDTTAVTAAYNNLNGFMAGVLADPDHASDVDRVTYKRYQDAYNEELAKLQNALQNNTNNKFTSAASATSQAASTANTAKSAADSTYNYANSEIAVQSTATAKAQSRADDAFNQAQAVGKHADSEIAAQSNATVKAQNTADNAFSKATTAIDNGKVTSQTVTDLKGGSKLTIAELENGLAKKVANSDYASYKVQTASQIAQKVDNGAFSAYQQTTANLISSKVATKDFSAYQATTAKAIESKVESNDFNTYKTQTANLINDKVSSAKYTSDKTQTANLIAEKVATKDFSTYKTQTANLIAEKVATKDFSTYKTQTANLISEKVATKDFSAYKDTTAKAISSKVESKDFNTYKTQTTNMISQTVTNAISNISIGGTNLIANSANTVTINGDAEHYKIIYYNLTPGTWTFSSSAKYTQGSATAVSVVVYDAGHKNWIIGNDTVNIVNGRLTTTFTITDSVAKELLVYAGNNGYGSTVGNILQLDHYQLEKGNKATDWSPAPEDLATQSEFTQLSGDINLRVTKKDLLDQINIQAGYTLISSSGQLTLSGKNIYFDSVNPVMIPSANIDRLLVGKQLTAADISANTFSTNNGTFMVDKNGAITAKNMTLIGGTLSSPTINASTINGSTINGTTFHGGDIINNANNTSKLYPTTMSSDGHIYTTRFSSIDAMQTDLSTGSLTTKYRNFNTTDPNNRYEAYNTTIQANQISLFAGYTDGKDSSFTRPFNTNKRAGDGYVLLSPVNGITFHGDNQQITFNGTSGDVAPKGIIITPYGNINPVGTQNIWYVGNGPAMKTASFGIDGSGANNIKFNRSLDIGNFNIGTYHTITSSDGGPIHFNRANGNSVDIYADTVHYKSLVKQSLLSVKKDVRKADTAYWSQLINSIDLATYQYKTDDNTSHLRLSSIVDDVNVTKQWQLPDVFISRDENGRLNGVDDSVLLNATLATVQEQQKEIDQLNGHNMELEARLNKLEAKF
ncbi:phage tail protein [Lactiplantibacillus plantarum]|uniref:phage tail protein n=1 Tax=Lactiplantibacillus plantarum TaxID=1590 RepID=UPI00165143A4|nr:phage tail protein [Lactiplantibacillus plantarum]